MLEKVLEILKERNCKPLYVIRSGSFLYGTNSESSDMDFKVVFLSAKRDILLGKEMKQFEFTTGSNNSKNNKDDIDVSCKSIHTFLRDVARGEIGALDIAFSFTNEKAVLYKDPLMDIMFNNINKFFNIKNMKAFVGYANSQAIKYSLKGDRYNLIKNIVEFLHQNEMTDCKISDFAETLDEKYHDNSNFFIHEKDKVKFLHVLNADYMMSQDYEYFVECMESKLKCFGSRIKKCSEETADWKALSHAIRCINECKELMVTGSIQFPLKNKEYIKSVKYGHESLNNVLNVLEYEMKEIEELMKSESLVNTFDSDFVDEFILKFFDV